MTQVTADNKKDLMRFLIEQVKAGSLPKDKAVEFLKVVDGVKPEQAANQDIAIVGMACRFPEADNKEQFWNNLAQGKNSIRPFPEKRREQLTSIEDDDIELFHGGFLSSVEEFDNDFFNIPPAIAKHMDPYHRLFLQTLIETIEDAGYNRTDLQGKNVGIYAGNDHTHRLFSNYLNFIEDKDFNSITGSWTAVFASRLAYLLNLQGPALVIDTSCSSGLVAMDYAIKGLQAGDCESALVGAANLFFAPGKGIVGDVENDDFMVRTFDDKASGTVWGEGVASFLLKTVEQAEKDGDAIYGIIKGIAVNNDGASNGITAPNARAQQDVLLKAWKKADISPEQLSYIESHGTGTNLGDPIEIRGLSNAVAKHTRRKQFCGIGSVKTNIGHTVATAGLASLSKVLLSYKHQQLPPSLNFNQPNLFIDFANSPVYVNDSLSNWPMSDQPRYAGISSFSLSGTNCHLVLQDAVSDRQARHKTTSPQLLVLSARTDELLQQTAQRYLDFIRDEQPDLIHLCFTAAQGREQHDIRVALLVNSLDEAEAACNALLQNESAQHIIRSTNSNSLSGSQLDKQAKALTDGFDVAQATAEELTAIAQCYVDGARINWLALFADTDRKRVHLPAQPFKRDTFWLLPTKRVVTQTAEQTVDETAEIVQLITGQPARIQGISNDDSPDGLAGKFVAWVIAETLGYDDLTVDSDYYALGGDSITGTKITHILSDLLSIDVQPGDILAASNLGAFIQHVTAVISHTPGVIEQLQNKQARPTSTANYPVISSLPEQDHYDLSRAQQRMFVLAGLAPESTAYNVNAVVEIDELPDLSTTETLFNQLIARHDSLRTGFIMHGETPVQVIAPQATISLTHQTLTNHTDAVQRWASDFIQPFDLSSPPLMRLGFASSADNHRHYMILDMHHIITDGTSMGLLIAEYLQLIAGVALPSLTLQYKDFAHWHNQQLDTLEQQHKNYWLERFSEDVPEALLPLDHPRPAIQSFDGEKVQSLISHELLAQCKALAAAEGVSLFMLLSGVFRVLMAKYQVADDLVLGTPVAGRSRREWQTMIGMFVNTVALRFNIDQSQSFSDILTALKQQTLADFAHQDYPFELLPEQLNIPRNTAKNPLFDIYFVLQNEDMGLDGDGVSMLPVDTGIARFDLTIICRELKNQAAQHGMTIDWEFATSLFNADTIHRMATHFEQVLAQIIAQPKTAVSTLSCLTPDEYQKLVIELNQTDTNYPASDAVQVLFEQQVEQTPDAVAFRFVEQGNKVKVELTYDALNTAANQLAHQLISQGIQHQQIVALWLPRTVDMAIAILAVLKAGATYVPLDGANPDDRNQGILADSGAVLMLTHSSMKHLDTAVTTLIIDQSDLSNNPVSNPPARNNGESLIYLMYTSGTTGKPKGTQIRHKSVTRVVCDTNYMTLTPDDVCLQISSFAFDGCVADFYGALLNGGRVILTSKEDTLEPHTLADVITSQKVTSMFVTTALFNIISDNLLNALSSIKTIMFGGEAVSVQHVIKARKALGPGKLIHVYGPTESTVFATGYVINDLPDSAVTVPIGPAIANTRVYVLDDYLKPVPFGISGELFIGGDGIALGYLNRPDLTDERFIPSPFVQGDRLYRTGDVVTCLPDGSIVYQSRKDHQVKIRGFRIELDEIKAILNQNDSVIDSYVTADPDTSGTRQLLSWVMVEQAETFDSLALITHLRHTLPDYMVPVAVTPVESFPLNNNGKLDKTRLPAPQLTTGETVAARDNIEQTMLDVWQDVLQSADLGVTDNFFSVGGDSIKGIQVVARLQEQGITIDTATLFQHQNIEALAKHAATTQQTTVVPQVACDGELTLNPIQRWFIDAIEQQALTPDAFNHFNQAMRITLDDSAITEQQLKAALHQLATHHDMLRVVFDRQGNARFNTPEQPACVVKTITFNTSSLVEDDFTAFVQTLQQGIDIERGIHLAAGLITLNNGTQQQLVIAIHHLVVDVISWSVLLNDLMTLLDDSSATLPAKTVSQQDWNNALLQHADSPQVLSQKDYWLAMARHVDGVSVVDGTEHEHPGRVSDAAITQQSAKVDLTEQLLNDANSAFNTEPWHLLLAALTLASHKQTTLTSPIVNLETHGRDPIPESDTTEPGRTVGWFTATCPFPLNNEQTEIGDLIKDVKERVRRMPGNGRDFGLLRWLSSQLSTSEQQQLASIQPNIGFNYLGLLDGDQQVQPLDRSLTTSPQLEQTLPLDLVLFVRDEQLTIELMYDTKRINSHQADTLLNDYLQALSDITAFCSGQQHTEKTATDFTVTELEQDEFDDILDDIF